MWSQTPDDVSFHHTRSDRACSPTKVRLSLDPKSLFDRSLSAADFQASFMAPVSLPLFSDFDQGRAVDALLVEDES